MIWDRRKIAIGFFIFMLGAGVFVIFLQRPLYRAWTTVIIDIKNPSLVETQKEIIKSRRNAYYVSRNLELSKFREFRKKGDPLKALLEKVNVERVGETNVLKINAYHAHPRLASHIANEFARVYLKVSLKRGWVDDAWVQDIAEIPVDPTRPKKGIIMALSFIIGVVGGIAILLFKKENHNFSATRDDTLPSIELPILGVVPKIRIDGKGIKKDKDKFFIVANDSYYMASEAYRSIRNNLLFSLKDFRFTSILVTSPVPREGKTVTAVNLAVMGANSGERVLLVDANIKRPSIHTVFDRDNGQGFSDFLSQELDFDDVIRHSGVDNLYFVTSGKGYNGLTDPNFIQRSEIFLDKAKAQFSKIIFDASSVTHNTHTPSLSGVCAGVLLVARRNTIADRLFNDSKNLLETRGANILGVILNNVEVCL